MPNHSLIIGLTGNIATGKSTVLEYLSSKGAQVIDADKLAHKAMERNGPAYGAVVEQFGQEILQPDGAIDRQRLGKIVFANARKLGDLEKIIHPVVFAYVYQAIDNSTAGVVVLEAVKLLEAGALATLCDEIWVVTARPAVQIQRLKEKRNMDEDQALKRMQLQSPQASKINQADRVIENNGSPEELFKTLDRIWEDLQRKYSERLVSPAL